MNARPGRPEQRAAPACAIAGAVNETAGKAHQRLAGRAAVSSAFARLDSVRRRVDPGAWPRTRAELVMIACCSLDTFPSGLSHAGSRSGCDRAGRRLRPAASSRTVADSDRLTSSRKARSTQPEVQSHAQRRRNRDDGSLPDLRPGPLTPRSSGTVPTLPVPPRYRKLHDCRHHETTVGTVSCCGVDLNQCVPAGLRCGGVTLLRTSATPHSPSRPETIPRYSRTGGNRGRASDTARRRDGRIHVARRVHGSLPRDAQ